LFTLGRFFLAAVRACKQKRLHRLVNMPNSVLEGDNNRNEQDNEHEHDEYVLDSLEELDANTWVATGEMQKLPTSIFKNNSLSPSTRKTILQSEPRNKDISFEPPIMDKKLWSNMPKFAKEQDKTLRRVAYKVSSAVRPIDNTLRLAYTSEPEDSDGDQYKAWLHLEQTVLNTRALVLYSLSYVNEVRREQALKTTISPNYQRPVGKEEVFGEELYETIKNENEANKLLNDAAWQRKRAAQNSSAKNEDSSFHYRMPAKSYYSKGKTKYKPGQGKSQNSGNEFQGDRSVRQSQ
jgi:hypothetical protein